MPDDLQPKPAPVDLLERLRSHTPARLLEGRAGAAYRTSTQLKLREAHAAARDAVRDELEIRTLFSAELIDRFGIFEVVTEAGNKEEYLLRPDLGRKLTDSSRRTVTQRCKGSPDVQFVIGDGLSVAAVAAQVPKLLPLLSDGAKSRGWTVGNTFVVRHCRVGVMNDVGELLDPRVVVLLIGERPGLATAESLSAYLAFRPRRDHADANRNLISNIHGRGVRTADAAERILNFASQMMAAQLSGTNVREHLVGKQTSTSGLNS